MDPTRVYREGHPAEPVLVVEVSKTRLEFDRARKSTLYARNGIQEYWKGGQRLARRLQESTGGHRLCKFSDVDANGVV